MRESAAVAQPRLYCASATNTHRRGCHLKGMLAPRRISRAVRRIQISSLSSYMVSVIRPRGLMLPFTTTALRSSQSPNDCIR